MGKYYNGYICAGHLDLYEEQTKKENQIKFPNVVRPMIDRWRQPHTLCRSQPSGDCYLYINILVNEKIMTVKNSFLHGAKIKEL